MLTFRTATPTDVEPLHDLVNRCFRGDSAKEGWTHEAEMLEGERIDPPGLLELMQTEGSQIELAFEGDQMVGCVHLKHTLERAYVGLVSVDPSQQARGLGRQILAHCEELANGWDCTQIGMTVINLRVELIAYYERRGYHLTGQSEPFPWGLSQPKTDGPELFLLEMKKSL
jgi:GNAT superfamily N-acetyltransferase